MRNLLQNAVPGAAPPTAPAYPPAYPPGNGGYTPAPSALPYTAPVPRPYHPGPNRETVADLQRMLLALGYDAGVADGSAGPHTVEALRAFQRDHGEVPTGEITAETVAAVRSVWLDRNPSGSSVPGPSPSSAPGTATAQPSFDCTRASTPTERRICASPALAELDAEVSNAYSELQARLSPQQQSDSSAEQREWLRQRNNCGSNAACLEKEISERLAQLRSQGGSQIVADQPGTDRQVPGVAPGGSAANNSAGIESLLHPPAGFRALNIPVREGRPIFNLDSQVSRDEATFFGLVALRMKPDLLDSNERSDYALQLANDLLTKPTKYLAAYGGWAGQDEFQKDASRRAFVHDLGGTLRRMAPALPFEFAYATVASLGEYDRQLGGFKISGQPVFRPTLFGPLQPVQDFEWPQMFVPIDEAGARQLLDQLRGAGNRDPRAAQLVAVIEATSTDPDSMQLRLHLRRLALYDPNVRQSLYEFPVPNTAAPSPQDLAAYLMNPPPGIMPIKLPRYKGRVMLDAYDKDSISFETLVAIGSMPHVVHAPPGAGPSVQQAYDDSAEFPAARLLTPEVQRRLLAQPGFQYGATWYGSDEFARARTRQSFEQEYLPKLKAFAPKPPFEFAAASQIALPEYDMQRGGFAISKAHAQVPSTSGSQWSLDFDSPDLFASMNAQDAERLLHRLEQNGSRDPGAARLAKVVFVVEVTRIDPDSGRTQSKVKEVDLCTRDLHTVLYTFPLASPEPEPYLEAAIPDKLDVPNPAPLDSILLDVKLIGTLGDQAPANIYDDLWRRIADRDEAFYARPNHWDGLSPNDARRPFFPQRGAERTEAGMRAFIRWARAYAAGLPDSVQFEPSATFRDTNGGPQYDSVPGDATSGYQKFLQTNGLQADQLVMLRNPPALAILPNSNSLYSLTIDSQELKSYRGPTPRSILVAKMGGAELVSHDQGGSPTIAVELEPLSATALADQKVIATHTFKDIPRLSGSSFVAAAGNKAVSPVPAATYPLDAALIDLITTKNVGDQLSREALVYLILRRWTYENHAGTTVGGRFFTLGKREPSADEALNLRSEFLAWAREHGPALPVRVTLASKVIVAAGQTAPATYQAPRLDASGEPTVPAWSGVSCLGGTLSAWNVGSALMSAQRQKEGAISGMGAWSAADEQKLVAMTALQKALYAMYFGSPTDACRSTSPQLAFRDPLAIAIFIGHGLPVPTVTALGDSQVFNLTVMIDITSVTLSSKPPSLADKLPGELARALQPSQPDAQTGDYVTLDAHFAGARYAPLDGHDATQFGPDQGTSVAAIADALHAQLKATVAQEATPAGPYGPDLIGVQLGMSFADAERAIRQHMKVGKVVDGPAAADASGMAKPLQSGKLFISENGGDMIAIFDQPPTAKGRVLAAWRRIKRPAGSIEPSDIFAALQQKYGKPGGMNAPRAGTIVTWYQLTGSVCAGLYVGGTNSPAGMWFDNAQPMPGAATATDSDSQNQYYRSRRVLPGQRVIQVMPTPFFDPLAKINGQWSHCGPFVTAEVLPAKMVGANEDIIDVSLTDIGAYVAAYTESWLKQQDAATTSGGPAPPVYTGPYGPDMVGVQLGMSFADAERVIRAHMKVGRVLEPASPATGARSAISGKLFVSEDGSELMAILDEPQGATAVVTAGWREIYAPTSATLDFVATRMKDKYGDPAYRNAGGDLLLWGKAKDASRCNAAYAGTSQTQTPIVTAWLENGVPTAWRPPNGDKTPGAPGLPPIPAPNSGAPIEDCGPYVTMRFLPAQGYPPMNVIETTLTDMARQEKALVTEARAEKAASSAGIKF